jgi:hypothetical protein
VRFIGHACVRAKQSSSDCDSDVSDALLPSSVKIRIQDLEFVLAPWTGSPEWIPRLPTRGPIILRDDLTFGENDYAVWPQTFDPAFPHLCAIFARPVVLETNPGARIMTEHELYWGSLQPAHCEQRGEQMAICAELQAQLEELNGSALDMFAKQDGPPVEEDLAAIYRACIARSRAVMSASELMLVFRALQRTRLEWLAWAGWYCQTGPLDDIPRLGCFGADPGIAALLVKRAIPVWTINLTDDAGQPGKYTELVVSKRSAPREGPLGRAPAAEGIHPGAQPLILNSASSGSVNMAIRQYTRDLLGLSGEARTDLQRVHLVRTLTPFAESRPDEAQSIRVKSETHD